MSSSGQVPAVLIASTLIVADCGMPATAPADDVASRESTTVTTVGTVKPTTTPAAVTIDNAEDTHVTTSKVESSAGVVPGDHPTTTRVRRHQAREGRLLREFPDSRSLAT